MKGRFPSLRGLRINVNSANHIAFASAWVAGCIALHTFALYHESIEDYSRDEFYAQGRRIMQEEREGQDAARELRQAAARLTERQRERARDAELVRARAKREELKAAWLAS